MIDIEPSGTHLYLHCWQGEEGREAADQRDEAHRQVPFEDLPKS